MGQMYVFNIKGEQDYHDNNLFRYTCLSMLKTHERHVISYRWMDILSLSINMSIKTQIPNLVSTTSVMVCRDGF
jgi:hypothetical protein